MASDKTTTSTELAPAQDTTKAIAAPVSFDLDVQRVVAMRTAVEQVVAKVLNEGEHYGVIPGTSRDPDKKPKKALLQPGAEVLAQVFRLRPTYEEMTVVEQTDFIYYKVRCQLYSAATGELVGEAIGSANTREDRYAKQTSERTCPLCGAAAIIKGSDEYGGGYVCWKKKNGCGAKFADDDKKLLGQTGVISTTKVWGLHHTILSMAQKRTFVKAVRTATGTSDIFTDEDIPPQDPEQEHDPHGDGQRQTKTASAPPQSQQKARPAPKADPIRVRDLNLTMVDANIGTSGTENMQKGERDETVRRARLAWVNARLDELGEAKVSSLMDLTPIQVDHLINEAKRG